MPDHRVKAHIQVIELTKRGSAVRFEIFADDAKIGEIQIGKGSFGWKSPNKQTFQQKDWTTFCYLLEQHF